MRSLKEREWFYSQEKEPLPLKSPAPYEIYRLKTTGQVVCEHVLDIGLGAPVEISMLADLHLNFCTPEDMQDEESAYTYECRLWGRNGAHAPAAASAMYAASFSDYTVVLGDILDFLSHGSLLLTKRYVIDPYPEAMLTIGWHDITKQMQTKRPNLRTNEERIAILESVWPHDIHYYKRPLGEELIALCLGQTHTKYSSDITERLRNDIEEARKCGKYIIIFQHEPFSTGKECDGRLKCHLYRTEEEQTINLFDNATLMCRPDDTDEVNRRVYEIIKDSADVVKAIFVGHEHFQTYSEIPAKAHTADGVTDAVIPQHVVQCTPYYKNGYYMRVTVK